MSLRDIFDKAYESAKEPIDEADFFIIEDLKDVFDIINRDGNFKASINTDGFFSADSMMVHIRDPKKAEFSVYVTLKSRMEGRGAQERPIVAIGFYPDEQKFDLSKPSDKQGLAEAMIRQAGEKYAKSERDKAVAALVTKAFGGYR